LPVIDPMKTPRPADDPAAEATPTARSPTSPPVPNGNGHGNGHNGSAGLDGANGKAAGANNHASPSASPSTSSETARDLANALSATDEVEADSDDSEGEDEETAAATATSTAATTAPVAIPAASNRRRCDSNDSLEPSSVGSVGSWQMVDDKAPLSNGDGSGTRKHPPPLNIDMHASTHSRASRATLTRREQRLLAVREAFVPLYREIIPESSCRGDGWLSWLGGLVPWPHN